MFSLIVYKSSRFVDGTPIKVCRLYPSSKWKKCYLVVYSVLVYVIPVIVLFILYTKVIRKLRAAPGSGNSIEFNESYRCSQDRHRIRKQVVNIIICVVVVFFICHLPFRMIGLFFLFSDKRTIRNLGLESYLSILNYSRCLLYLNHALNPILYNFVSTKFRSAFRYMVFKGSRATYSDKRNQSPGQYFQTQKDRSHRIVFKRKNATPPGSVRDRDQGSSSSDTQRQNRNDRNKYLLHFSSNSNPEGSDDSKLLVNDNSGLQRWTDNGLNDSSQSKWTDNCVNLEVNDKSSAKVRFIMTKDGYVIGITLHKLKAEEKDLESYDWKI